MPVPVQSAVSADPHCIAVLDGDPAVRDSLATLLALDGRVVATYPTAAAFLRVPAGEPIACVVCAAELPDRSGLEVFELVRARHPQARFALLMSRSDPQLVAQARELGIRDVFSKPLVHRNLLEFVEQSSAARRAPCPTDPTGPRGKEST